MRIPTSLPCALLALLAATVPAGAAKPEVPLPKDLPAYGADRPLPVPQVTETVLPNGLTVWAVPRPGFPRVVARLSVRGGTAADPAGSEGLARLLGDALKEGTATRSAARIAEELQGVGGDLQSQVSDDAVALVVDGLSTGARTLLEVLADVALHPAFPPAEVELVKANALQALLAAESTPEFAVEKAFATAVYGPHPYHVTATAREAIAAVTPALLRAEHARRFRPDRALLIVVGDVDAALVAAEARARFGAWQAKGEAPPPTAAPPATVEHRIVIVDRPGSVQSEIRVGRSLPPPSDADYVPLVVANTIFGGAFSSRLTENIREDKGYTYSPGSEVDPRAVGSLLEVGAAVRNDVTAATLLEIFYELDRMGATLPTDDELARAKRYQSGLFVLRNQINAAVAALLAADWVDGLPRAAFAEFVPRVNAVTAETVRAMGRKYLASRNQTVVIGGDAAQVREAVAVFAPVEAAAGGGPGAR